MRVEAVLRALDSKILSKHTTAVAVGRFPSVGKRNRPEATTRSHAFN